MGRKESNQRTKQKYQNMLAKTFSWLASFYGIVVGNIKMADFEKPQGKYLAVLQVLCFQSVFPQSIKTPVRNVSNNQSVSSSANA